MMMPLIRLFLLWVAVTMSSHLALSHFWQGLVAERTLKAGTEPNSIKFLALLLTFGISVYYFWCEMGRWKAETVWKTLVASLAVVTFLFGILVLDSVDQIYYRGQADYQKKLVAGRLGADPEFPFTDMIRRVSPGLTPEEVAKLFPDSLPSKLVTRRDGSAYQDYLYWMGNGTFPIGVHVSYSKPPCRVTKVEVLPRLRPLHTVKRKPIPFSPEKETQ